MEEKCQKLYSPNNRPLIVLIPTRQRVPNHTACRPAQNTLQPREILQINKPSIATHKLNARTRDSGIAQLVVESLEEPI